MLTQTRAKNIRQVAAMAGVSPVTVARVFSGKAPVAKATKNRILAVAEQLNYRPDPIARALAGGDTHVVGMLWSLGGAPHSEGMARNLAQRFQSRGYATYLADTVGGPQGLVGRLDDFLMRRVEGVVLQWADVNPPPAEILERLTQVRAAVVVHPCRCQIPVDVVVHDRTAAMRQVAEHLVVGGRRRIAFMAPASPSNQMKLDALRQRCAELADVQVVSVPVQMMSGSRPHPDDYVRALSSVWQGEAVGFDAVLCSVDEGAAAVMHWLQARGSAVPRDVAVVGFNDSQLAQYLKPSLASVARQDEELAAVIETVLFGRLSHPDEPRVESVVPMRFIPRESCGETPV